MATSAESRSRPTLRSLHTTLTWLVVVIGRRGEIHANHEVFLSIDVH